ncbi:unnamed protein product [Clonostachys rosea]|uniref:Heterokaryon incompatibility domain-containing protein n=1 Tax=Bionectria ochroleuca TaxID=29856 RepID=A0ABY6UTK9_BIOOC|nr:unnamed protein product [Clonostachys rosea]
MTLNSFYLGLKSLLRSSIPQREEEEKDQPAAVESAAQPAILESKAEYKIWAEHMRSRFRSWGVEEARDGTLLLGEGHGDIILSILVEHMALELFYTRQVPPVRDPSELWVAVREWSSSPKRCFICENFQRIPKMSWHNALDRISTVQELQKSAKAGCFTCQSILDALEAFIPKFTELETEKKRVTIRQHPSQGNPLVLAIRDNSHNGLWTTEDEFLLEVIDGDQESASVADLFEDHDWAWASRLLQDCNCLPVRERTKGKRPRRLVRILPGSKRLVLVENPPSNASYCALSYCWGKSSHNLLTTLNTLEKHKRGISRLELPKTVLHAVIACEKLGFEYLWVDALCIIQDDEGNRDWSEQCNQMADIYSQATLVIAVHDAADCAHGFLEREEVTRSSQEFLTRDESGAVQRKGVRERILGLHELPNYLQANTPLSSRGWTLQETLLATRILHFAENEMIWECGERFQCGCAHSLKKGLLVGRELLQPRAGFSAREREVWQGLVACYSNRKLTNEQDKLPAMTATSAHLASMWKLPASDFLAGLWREDLIRGLLWFPAGRGPHARPSAYCGPTWSWLSITGGVGYPPFSSRPSWKFFPTAEIIDCQTSTTTSNPFGRISRGSVVIKSTLVPVDLAWSRQSYEASRRNEYNSHRAGPRRVHTTQTCMVRDLALSRSPHATTAYYEVLCDESLDDSMSCDPANEVCWLNGRCQLGLEHCACGKEAAGPPRFFCLQIGTLENVPDKGIDGNRSRGRHRQTWWLVLKRSESQPGAFERVGIGCQNTSGYDCQLFEGGEVDTIRII